MMGVADFCSTVCQQQEMNSVKYTTEIIGRGFDWKKICYPKHKKQYEISADTLSCLVVNNEM